MVAGGERRLRRARLVPPGGWRCSTAPGCSRRTRTCRSIGPPQLGRSGPATWRFGFLQHGVIKDDLSRWLNASELDLFVVSTAPELASVAGDGTAYRFTAKETRNTGLPRFDRLVQLGTAVPAAERDLVIVAPTWRQWLTLPLASGSQRRALDARLLGFRVHPELGCAPPIRRDRCRARPSRLAARLHAPPEPPGDPRADGPAGLSSSCRSPARTSRPCTGAARCWSPTTRPSRSTRPTSTGRSSTSSSTATRARRGPRRPPGLLRLLARRVRAGRGGPGGRDREIVAAIDHGRARPSRISLASETRSPCATAAAAPGSWPRSRT